MSASEAQEFFDRIHEITDRMEEDNGTARSDIKGVYDEASDKLGVKKAVLKHLFRKERRARKDDAKEMKMDAREKEGLEKLAQAYGDDSPMGQWAAAAAKRAGSGPGTADED